jgi:hypothetical protein
MLSWLRRKPPEPPEPDHLWDFTAEDFARPQPTVLEPATVLLARLLADLTPAQRRVLAESETDGGWPARWKAFYEDEGWPVFRDRCCAALVDFHVRGVPLEVSLSGRGMDD